MNNTAIVIQAEATEQQLIDRARAALDNSHWVVGQCASEWTQRYAKGRTDADFGNLVGLSPQQIRQCRSVWETFSDVSKTFSKLSWSHFLVALSWDDAAECLQWANDEGWSVREMQAWRKSQHENGNHASDEPESEPEEPPTAEHGEAQHQSTIDEVASGLTEMISGVMGAAKAATEPQKPEPRPSQPKSPPIKEAFDPEEASCQLRARLRDFITRELEKWPTEFLDIARHWVKQVATKEFNA